MKSRITLTTLFLATLPAFAGTIISPAGIGGIGTTAVSGSAMVEYLFYSPTDPTTLSTSASADAMTLGPVRSGFIEITGSGGGEFGYGMGSVGGYGFSCGSVGCSGALLGEPLPFTLGVPFTIDVSAFAAQFGEGSGDISFQFSLYENVGGVPGLVPIIVYDASSVPEPGTLAPVGLLLFVAGLRWSRVKTTL